jgi:hypothetical protein
VRASNFAGDSDYSNEASATTLTSGADLPLADLRLWLRADVGVARQSTNDLVSNWSDQSGHGNHAVQTTAASQPRRMTNVINGRPAIRFDGTDDRLDLPNFLTGYTQAEAFVVLKATADMPGSGRALWRMGGAASSAYPISDGTIRDDFGSTIAKNLPDPSQQLDQAHLYNVFSRSNEWASRINGLLHYTTTNNTVLFNASFVLGWCHPTYFSGDIAEVIICNRVLTSDERETTGRYLSLKYGLAASPSIPSNLVASAVSSNHVSLNWRAGFIDS